MRIINLGGATAILEHRGKRMLFDPWLDEGIFHGSWFHWPPVTAHIGDLGRFDYVYISHIHEDHCSAGTIRSINRDAEIIIMDRQPNFVANFLRLHDFGFAKVHLVPPRKGLQITEDLFVDMIEADPANEMSYLIDSSIVIKWGERVVFNANDCQPHEDGLRYLMAAYSHIDLALLPYSGGSGYPSCYVDLTDMQKEAERDRILNQRVASFVAAAKYINPTFVMPFADQYVVGGSRAHLNRYVSHGASPAVVLPKMVDVNLQDRLVLLNSGQAFDLESRTLTPGEPYRTFTEEDREQHIAQSLTGQKYDHERVTFGPSVAVDRLVAHARERLWSVQERRKTFPACRLLLDFNDSGRRFEIDLACPGVSETRTDAPGEEPYLRVAGSDTLMVMLLIGHMSWNIADAALFLDYERRPNRYDPTIYVLLNFLKV
jgi:UDP-MurNAc hydroxylase